MARNRLLRTVVARVGRHTLPVLFLGLLAVVPLAAAESTGEVPPRALPQGQLPKDPRLQPLKDLAGYFPFKPRETPAEWDLRAEQVRRELTVALGLWPMPERTPLNAVIHGRIDQPDTPWRRSILRAFPGSS